MVLSVLPWRDVQGVPSLEIRWIKPIVVVKITFQGQGTMDFLQGQNGCCPEPAPGMEVLCWVLGGKASCLHYAHPALCTCPSSQGHWGHLLGMLAMYLPLTGILFPRLSPRGMSKPTPDTPQIGDPDA